MKRIMFIRNCHHIEENVLYSIEATVEGALIGKEKILFDDGNIINEVDDKFYAPLKTSKLEKSFLYRACRVSFFKFFLFF